MISRSVLSTSVVLACLLAIASAQIYFPPDDQPESVENYGRCLTPNRERALCIKLDQCPFLYDLLQKRPLSNADRSFLTSSQCGYTDGSVLICCPGRYIGQKTPQDIGSRKEQGTLPAPGVCGNVISNRIYGGNVTKIDEYPWMALIEYDKGGSGAGHHCGGSLINERYVLTAAHCIRAIPETWTPVRVRLGEWDTSSEQDCEQDSRGFKDCSDPYIDVPIEKVIPHERYVAESKNQLFDIALLRLQRSVSYTDFIRPICLPVAPHLKRTNFDGIIMDVSGWGKTEQGSSSSIKLKAGVAGVPLSECQRVYKQRSVELENSQICAGGEMGIDSCRGDSGGPLISLDASNKSRIYYFIAGVVSFGPTPCGLKGWPGVYTRVSDYVDWIKNNIEA